MLEMSRKETAEKSRIRLWRSTLGTLISEGNSAFQFMWNGSRSISARFTLELSLVWQKKSVIPFCQGEVVRLYKDTGSLALHICY